MHRSQTKRTVEPPLIRALACVAGLAGMQAACMAGKQSSQEMIYDESWQITRLHLRIFI